MLIRHTLTTAIIGMALIKPHRTTNATRGEDARMLFDFTKASSVDDWTEVSDTVREVGKSKAVLTLQKTDLFQRAIFFTLLNPQVNGAGFAGVRIPTALDLTGYKSIEIFCRAQGSNENYKIVLGDGATSADSKISYEQFFSVPTSGADFRSVRLKFAEFKAYSRGRAEPNQQPLDIANITTFGIQIYGGVYSPVKQKGVSSLEIDTIVATR